MNHDRRSWLVVAAITVLLGCGIVVPGCGSEEEKVGTVLPLEGKVLKCRIKKDGTGQITIKYLDAKTNKELTGTGEVTKDTEITINGAPAPLQDVLPDDYARGEVRIDKRGDRIRRIALMIHIERDAPYPPPETEESASAAGKRGKRKQSSESTVRRKALPRKGDKVIHRRGTTKPAKAEKESTPTRRKGDVKPGADRHRRGDKEKGGNAKGSSSGGKRKGDKG